MQAILEQKCVLYIFLTLNTAMPLFSCIYSDMEVKFRERDEREEYLLKAKEKLENDIADIMKMSGDNSSQLTKMNDELRLKERYARRESVEECLLCIWFCSKVWLGKETDKKLRGKVSYPCLVLYLCACMHEHACIGNQT